MPYKTKELRQAPRFLYGDLIKEVEDILELPAKRNKGKGFQIVHVVIQAITKALRKGESVKIVNFGTFRVKNRKISARRIPLKYYKGPNGEQLFMDYPYTIKRVVTFTPCREIRIDKDEQE